MPLDDSVHIEFMREVSQGIGRIEAGQKSTNDHLAAVSANQKATATKLDVHMADQTTAHGAGARDGVWSSIGKVIAAVAATAAILAGAAKLARAWIG